MTKEKGCVVLVRSVVAAVILVFAAGCCPVAGRAPFVAVRETQFRSDEHALPLAPGARAALLVFLRAGGDRNGIDDGTIVYPDAETRWGPMLTKLGATEHTDVADLTNGTYAPWLTGEPLRNVVDARHAAIAFPWPHVMQQGRFEWIFVAAGDKLASVFVQQAVAPREQ